MRLHVYTIIPIRWYNLTGTQNIVFDSILTNFYRNSSNLVRYLPVLNLLFTVPDAPGALYNFTTREKYISFNWSMPPSGTYTKYGTRYFKENTDPPSEWEFSDKPKSVTEKEYSDLEPGVRYCVQVVAIRIFEHDCERLEKTSAITESFCRTG